MSASNDAFGFAWDASFLVGHGEMDDTHHEFVDCVDALLRASDAQQSAALAGGRHTVVREFAWALADWFPRHAQVMDLGLARWLNQRRLGGAPVLFQRPKPKQTQTMQAVE